MFAKGYSIRTLLLDLFSFAQPATAAGLLFVYIQIVVGRTFQWGPSLK